MRNIGLFLFITGIIFFSQTVSGLTLTAEDIGGGKLQIGYQADAGEIPLGFALRITLGQGAFVSGESDLLASPYFPIYNDYAFAMAGSGYIPGEGHCAALPYMAGIPAFPVSDFVVCLAAPLSMETGSGLIGDLNWDGYVDEADLMIFSEEWLMSYLMDSGSLPADLNGDSQVDLQDYVLMSEAAWDQSLSNLVTIQLSDGGAGFSNVLISLDPLRGGIAGQNITGGADVEVTVMIPEPASLTLLALGGLMIGRRYLKR